MIHYRKLRGEPEDSFAKSLLKDLAALTPCDAFYYDYVDLKYLIGRKFSEPVVLILVRDLVEDQSVLRKIITPGHLFVFATEHEGLSPDINYISIGGSLVDEIEYKTLKPPKKNFDSTKIGMSLNRQMRPHRIALVSYLVGCGLLDRFHVSAMHLHKQFDKVPSHDILDHLSWQFTPAHHLLKHKMTQGMAYLHNSRDQFDVDEIYALDGGTITSITNADNFKNKLSKLYENSFVEIVSESEFDNYPVITEKYLNSVYGRNFPIAIAAPGYIHQLRSAGFDVFDDVVDHGYDLIADPADRLRYAIDKNMHLFQNSTKQLWQDNLPRFDKNIAFARKDMYTFFHNRAIIQYKNILCQNNLMKQI